MKGEGRADKTLEYERDGKVVKRKLMHKKQGPCPKTINGENVVLRGIFKHAQIQGWLTVQQMLKIENAEITTQDAREGLSAFRARRIFRAAPLHDEVDRGRRRFRA